MFKISERTSNFPVSKVAAAGFNLILSGVLLLQSPVAFSDSKVFAYRLFNRLNGVPPSAEKLAEISKLVEEGKYDQAGLVAVNDPSGNFYNITLKDLFTRWSNTDRSPRRPLNDVVATAIGIVRDDLPFGQFLYEDVVYVADSPQNSPAYSLANNDMYVRLEASDANFSKNLRRSTQTMAARLSPEIAVGVAGVFSLRAFGEAYYSAGTNRRAFAFSMKNFLCRSMESLGDTSRPDIRVRRDVSRSPGGYAAKFRNECVGCHAGMDGFAGAFAHYDYANRLIYTPGVIQEKYSRNATEFPDGYFTTDESWVNMWVEGRNKSIGWGGPTSGSGVKTFGEMLASTQGFATCMAETAVESMCSRDYDPNVSASHPDKDAIEAIAQEFKANGNLKTTFIKAAVYCSK